MEKNNKNNITEQLSILIGGEIVQTPYKYSLVFSLIEICQEYAVFAQTGENGRTTMPLGLLVWKWIEYYYPYVASDTFIALLSSETPESHRSLKFRVNLSELAMSYGWNCGLETFNDDLKYGKVTESVTEIVSDLIVQIYDAITNQAMKFFGHREIGSYYSYFTVESQRSKITANTELKLSNFIEKLGSFSFPTEWYNVFTSTPLLDLITKTGVIKWWMVFILTQNPTIEWTCENIVRLFPWTIDSDRESYDQYLCDTFQNIQNGEGEREEPSSCSVNVVDVMHEVESSNLEPSSLKLETKSDFRKVRPKLMAALERFGMEHNDAMILAPLMIMSELPKSTLLKVTGLNDGKKLQILLDDLHARQYIKYREKPSARGVLTRYYYTKLSNEDVLAESCTNCAAQSDAAMSAYNELQILSSQQDHPTRDSELVHLLTQIGISPEKARILVYLHANPSTDTSKLTRVGKQSGATSLTPIVRDLGQKGWIKDEEKRIGMLKAYSLALPLQEIVEEQTRNFIDALNKDLDFLFEIVELINKGCTISPQDL